MYPDEESLFDIAEIIILDNYDGSDLTYYLSDVALIRLDSPIRFNEYIQPVLLPWIISKEMLEEPASIFGWGVYNNTHNSTSYKIRTAEVKTTKCLKSDYDQFNKEHICALGESNESPCYVIPN